MPPKSILRKEGKTLKKSIVWDENAIAAHDLERGGKMKIDEPKTPFIHYSIDSDTILGNSLEPPSMVLEEAVEKINIGSETVDWSSGDEVEKHSDQIDQEDEKELRKQKQREFDRKRKLHYNMKTALKHKDF